MLGNIKSSQGLFDSSFVLHQQALIQVRQTVGPHNIATLSCMVKVAEHHVRHKDYESARYSPRSILQRDEMNANAFSGVLNTILDGSHDLPRSRPEIAKASFLYAECLDHQANDSDARTNLRRAVILYNEVYAGDPRTEHTIAEGDLNGLFRYDHIWC